MKPVVDFINCLGRVFDTIGLAAEGHVGLMTAMEAAAYDALCLLLKRQDEVVFLFTNGDVIFTGRRVQGLSDRGWTTELVRLGVERIEISRGVTRQEFGAFVDVLLAVLSRSRSGVARRVVPQSENEFPHIRFGQRGMWGKRGRKEGHSEVGAWLQDELEAAEFLMEQAARRDRISKGLAWTIVKSLYGAMCDAKNVLRLLVSEKEADHYTAAHSVNAALLAMAVVEPLGSSESQVRAVGEAAILHDVGQARVPNYIVDKPGRLSPREWEVVKRHPTDGARMLLDSGPGMDLAATVAFEHHIGYDGNGYPALHYRRKLHPATQALQVCDVYDALRQRRPFRDPWPPGRIKDYLQAESGRSLYPAAVEGFTRLLDRDMQNHAGSMHSTG